MKSHQVIETGNRYGRTTESYQRAITRRKKSNKKCRQYRQEMEIAFKRAHLTQSKRSV